MPYIDTQQKEKVWKHGPENASELCFVVAVTVDDYFKANGLAYQTYAEVIAALETAKLEVARRFQWYEEQKMRANGDVLRNTQQL